MQAEEFTICLLEVCGRVQVAKNRWCESVRRELGFRNDAGVHAGKKAIDAIMPRNQCLLGAYAEFPAVNRA